jgi:ketosteroid isomerase-like protein
MQQRRAAETQSDKSKWEALVANDCIWIEPNGRVTAAGAHRPSSGKAASTVSTEVKISDYQVHEHGDAAILMYREEMSSTVGDKKLTTIVRFSEVYHKLSNGWILVHSSETPIVERRGIAVDPAKFKDYIGEYQLAPGLVGVVALEGDKLTLFSKGWSKPFELLPLSENKFFVREFETTEITFVRDANGKVTHHVSGSPNQPLLVAKKIR